ncbi:ABC transporter substrate-binding protein [Cronbergia sp. UHCC 0137]|uniref:ABC transporter substrate-binding protein n=1 Tax=Cronbergia sp. UHCC 0137 TaxID=3110239 RepID=UPI002B21A94B|nr:ABC transporter substrate-binding protein [Cronbergia sp. UHCC 0137]MEA5619369.1 ABC transporter substrate-binding protein [Cronbergia sp. UHCC 0137]
MSKLFKYFSILLITGWLLFACHASTPNVVKRPPLKVACVTFIGYRPAIIAQEKGFFKAQGVEVELSYVDYAQLQQADFSAGKYDGIGLTLGDFMILSATNPDMQAVMVVDETNGADVVVAQSDIKTVSDLKGKKLGANLGGFSEVFVTEMLKQSNLTTDDVSLVKFDALQIPQRLENNTIQAGHTWEPYLSEAVKSGGHILFTSQQTPGLILDVVAFRGETIRDRPEEIRAFVRGWLEALNYWEANIETGNAIVGKALNIPLATISLDGVNLTDLEENQQFFRSVNANSIYNTAKIYADFFIRTGNVTRIPDIKTLFNSTFLTSPS